MLSKEIELISNVRLLLKKYYEGDESTGIRLLIRSVTDLLAEDDLLCIASGLLEDLINSKADLEIAKTEKETEDNK